MPHAPDDGAHTPLTGVACADRVCTDLAIFLITDHGVVVRDLFNVTFSQLIDLVEVPLIDGASR